MAEDRLERVRKTYGRLALKAMAEAMQHLRACPRCERLFLVAHEAHCEQSEEADPRHPVLSINYDQMWPIISEMLRDFANVPLGERHMKFRAAAALAL